MCAKSKTPKLTIELIPSTCHFSNVRTTIKKKEWDKIRFLSYEAAGHKCEICKSIGTEQGYKHNLECHEIWGYDDENHIQKLEGLISLCPICHQVKHIGLAIKMGRFGRCVKQLAIVNKWNREQIDAHVAESFEVYKERSLHEWALDLSLLNGPPYELNIDINEERIFEIKKYKKKRRKKKKPVAKKATPRKVATKKGNKRPPRNKT
jgi:hypothetical protein